MTKHNGNNAPSPMILRPKPGFLSEAVLAWLPFLVVFVFIPQNIVLPNLIEFDYDLSILIPFLTLGALSFIALMGSWFLKDVWRSRVFLGLFFVGAYLLLSDVFAPLHWNILDPETELSEPWKQTAVELVLVLLLLLCWVKIPTKIIRAFGVPLILVLLASQLFDLFLGWRASSEHGARERLASVSVKKPNSAVSQTKQGNVYHFVFDQYSSLIFLDTVRKLDLAATFTGFTYFEDTLSNYEATDVSVPSFLTGRIFSDGSVTDWLLEAKYGGLRKQLQDSGYEVSAYIPEKTRAWMFNGASHIRTSQELSKAHVSQYHNRLSAKLQLAQLSLVRLAPSALRVETFRSTSSLLGIIVAWLNDRPNSQAKELSKYTFYRQLSIPLIRQFLAEEQERKRGRNYTYVHVVLPHSPSVWDSECNYDGSTSFREQTFCATRMMNEIIDELKKLGRFDNSLIIFQSDHGTHRSGGGEPHPKFEPPQNIKDKVEAMVTPVLETEGYFRRIHPLLVIKPPFSAPKPLRISGAPAQLVDVPATIYKALGINGPTTDGKSVFDLRESEPREIHLYPGTFTIKARAETQGLGGKSTSSLAHISYTQGQGWRAYPDIPIRVD